MPFQAPTTKETKVSSSSTFSATTKQSATMQATQSSDISGSSIEFKNKQIKPNTLIETPFGNHQAPTNGDLSTVFSATNKINHSDSEHVNFLATNRSSEPKSQSDTPNSVSTDSNELNQFKSAVVKKDTKQQPVDYETRPASVNIVSPEEDKLCFEENGWPTTECSESAVSNCTFPYSGLTYRLCYSSCQWSKPDTSQCKLSSLGEIHNLVGFFSTKVLDFYLSLLT